MGVSRQIDSNRNDSRAPESVLDSLPLTETPREVRAGAVRELALLFEPANIARIDLDARDLHGDVLSPCPPGVQHDHLQGMSRLQRAHPGEDEEKSQAGAWRSQ
jgi:hypothetical protein